jgi:hypothetical protein
VGSAADDVWRSPPISGEHVIEEWVIVERWWTSEPRLRCYREVLTAFGRAIEMREEGSIVWVRV